MSNPLDSDQGLAFYIFACSVICMLYRRLLMFFFHYFVLKKYLSGKYKLSVKHFELRPGPNIL